MPETGPAAHMLFIKIYLNHFIFFSLDIQIFFLIKKLGVFCLELEIDFYITIYQCF